MINVTSKIFSIQLIGSKIHLTSHLTGTEWPGIHIWHLSLLSVFNWAILKEVNDINTLDKDFPWLSHKSKFLGLFNRDHAKKNRHYKSSYYTFVILRIEKPWKNI